MSGSIHKNYMNSPHIDGVVEEIVRLLSPQKIYLYNQRISAQGVTSSFKLCIVAQCPDAERAQRNIYLEVDCDVPFDILLYTPEQWEQLMEKDESFASRIAKSGMVVYG